GAVVLTNGDEDERPRLIDMMLAADGSLGDLLTVHGGGSAYPYKMGEPVGEEYFVQMQGRETFKHAVRSMTGICEALLERHGVDKSEIGVLVPHQANWRIIDAVGRKFDIRPERVYANIDRYANTSAASIPVALSEAVKTGFIVPGDLVLLTSFGGGFTWGSALIRF
ncbi:MAG: 3-oxoacyl-[acyl-carrier-protein] synthase III C-terminal domain-containing protein, partial [Pseudodesulfovibrio sp.]